MYQISMKKGIGQHKLNTKINFAWKFYVLMSYSTSGDDFFKFFFPYKKSGLVNEKSLSAEQAYDCSMWFV